MLEICKNIKNIPINLIIVNLSFIYVIIANLPLNIISHNHLFVLAAFEVQPHATQILTQHFSSHLRHYMKCNKNKNKNDVLYH